MTFLVTGGHNVQMKVECAPEGGIEDKTDSSANTTTTWRTEAHPIFPHEETKDGAMDLALADTSPAHRELGVRDQLSGCGLGHPFIGP